MSPFSNSSTDDHVTLPLHKFSYATTINERGKLVWSHLNRSDQFAVFDYVNAQPVAGLVARERLLKVIVGAETLVGSNRNPPLISGVIQTR